MKSTKSIDESNQAAGKHLRPLSFCSQSNPRAGAQVAAKEFKEICRRNSELVKAKAPAMPRGDIPYAKHQLVLEGRTVAILKWQPGARCLPHDHGSSSGLIYVVSGDVVEVQVHPHRSEKKGEMEDVVATPASAIHYLKCSEGLGAITVHFYDGPKEPFWVYDPDNSKRWLVPSEAKAWYPQAELNRDSQNPTILAEESCQMHW